MLAAKTGRKKVDIVRMLLEDGPKEVSPVKVFAELGLEVLSARLSR
jgi:hypothetical protein